MGPKQKLIVILFVLLCNCVMLIFSIYELRTIKGAGSFLAMALSKVSAIVGAIMPIICGA